MSTLTDYMNSEINFDNGTYLVISNFAYAETLAGEPINAYSGLSEEGFNYVVEASVEPMDAEVMFCDGNTAIIQGSPDELSLMEKLCGDRFSYAYCDASGAERVMDTCIEVAAMTPEEREDISIGGYSYIKCLE